MRVYKILLETMEMWRVSVTALITLILFGIAMFALYYGSFGSALGMCVIMFIYVAMFWIAVAEYMGTTHHVFELHKALNMSFYHAVLCGDLAFHHRKENAHMWLRNNGIVDYGTLSTRHNGFHFCFKNSSDALAFKVGYL